MLKPQARWALLCVFFQLEHLETYESMSSLLGIIIFGHLAVATQQTGLFSVRVLCKQCWREACELQYAMVSPLL